MGDQSLVNAPSLGGAPSPCGLTYLNKPTRGDKVRVIYYPANHYHSNISLVDGHQQVPKFIELTKAPLCAS